MAEFKSKQKLLENKEIFLASEDENLDESLPMATITPALPCRKFHKILIF